MITKVLKQDLGKKIRCLWPDLQTQYFQAVCNAIHVGNAFQVPPFSKSMLFEKSKADVIVGKYESQ